MRACLYARVSNIKQTQKNLSIPAQLREMRDYANQRGWQVVAEFYDDPTSGRTTNRTAFQNLLHEARKTPKPFDAVLVWKYSRFARNALDQLSEEQKLNAIGIEVISITEPVDKSPAGSLLKVVLAGVNEFYSNMLSEDIIRGMTENATRGYWNGSQAPIGYKIAEATDTKRKTRHKLIIDPIYAPVIKRIFRMYLDGHGAKNIARTLNSEQNVQEFRTKCSEFTSSHILRILNNERYTGTHIWKNIRIENNHPAIIDKETFQKAQQLRKTNTRQQMRHLESNYLLSGLFFCANGHAMVGCPATSHTKKIYYYYSCSGQRRGKKCDIRSIPQAVAEKTTLTIIRDYILEPEHIKQLEAASLQYTSEAETELQSIRHNCTATEQRLSHLLDLVESNNMDSESVSSRIISLENTLKSLREQEQLLENKQSVVNTNWVEYCRKFEETMRKQNIFHQKHVLKLLIDRIVFDNDNLIVIYRNLSNTEVFPVNPVRKFSRGFKPRLTPLQNLPCNITGYKKKVLFCNGVNYIFLTPTDFQSVGASF
jgi:DNA invertase Pin-like site-specific DNA recombinase